MDENFLNIFLSNLKENDIIKESIKIDDSILYGNFSQEKVSISKSELSKAVNVGAESGEPGFAFIPQVYDNKKLENETVKDMESWLKNMQKDLEKELDKFYGGL